jgi:arginine exporter protein ArgO
MTIDTIWYVLVALVLSNSTMLTKIEDNQRNLNVTTGVLMIGLAVWTGYKLSGL